MLAYILLFYSCHGVPVDSIVHVHVLDRAPQRRPTQSQDECLAHHPAGVQLALQV